MLRLSKKSDYALIAMKHLATRPDGGGSSSAREISESYDDSARAAGEGAAAPRARAAAGVGAGHARRLSPGPAGRADHGGGRDPGGRRSGHRDRVLDRRSQLRPVHEVQHSRPALEDQEPHPRSADHRVSVAEMAADADAPPRRRPTPTVSRMVFVPPMGSWRLRPRERDLPRSPRDDTGRCACARGDAAVLQREVRQRREPAASVWLGRRAMRSSARASRWRR